jgi:ABC-2 type transport system permease protein
VRTGALDFTLLQPADSQVLVSVREVSVYRLTDVALGAALLGAALARLGARLGPGRIAAFTLALAAGGAVVYAVWLALATCAFWWVRVDNVLVIFETLYDAGRWPVSIYPGWLRGALTFLIPVALATSVPVEALTGALRGRTLALAAVVAAAALVLSRLLWRAGLRAYSGASG